VQNRTPAVTARGEITVYIFLQVVRFKKKTGIGGRGEGCVLVEGHTAVKLLTMRRSEWEDPKRGEVKGGSGKRRGSRPNLMNHFPNSSIVVGSAPRGGENLGSKELG